MYPARSTIRFQTSHTAVVLKDNRIYQVKSPSNEKVFFDTVEQWVQSLPGPPSADVLVVTTTESEKKKITEKKPIKKCFHVPNKKISRYGGLKWGRHIYYAIKQMAPALLADDAIMDAYNTFIAAMAVEQPLYIGIPYGAHKYFRGISLEDHGTIPVQCTILNPHKKPHAELQVEKQEILVAYRAAYLPLYELIKRTIVPIIETHAVERRKKELTAYHTSLLMKVIQKQHRMRKVFEHKMKQYDSQVEYYQKMIEQEKNEKRRIFDWELPAASQDPCPVCAKPMCVSNCSC